MRRYCLVLAIMVVAGMSAPAVQADDNEIAQHIYQRLKAEQQAGNLRGYRVDMRVDHGTVWFKGFVANEDQEMLILRTAQQAGRLGVIQVVDDIDVQASAAPAMRSIREESMGQQPAMPVSYTQQAQAAINASVNPMRPQQAINAVQQTGPTAISQAPIAVASNGGTPMAVAYSGGMGVTTDNPQLPGYAWPAYAASPNYAAVNYPRQYSASAWPYIGPFYPYPQVPLGWRKVTMEWDDGWWYLDFKDR
jgi:hypothetical protein